MAVGARSRDLVWTVALVALVSLVWVARGDEVDAGIATPPGDGIDLVYVAVGTNFPDSLGVGPGAAVGGAPIIIVPTDPPIPGVTAAELQRLDPRRVVIVGGTAVVSDAMQDDIETLLPNALVERLAGANRYETNTLFSESVFPVERWVSVSSFAFKGNNPATDTVFVGIFASNDPGGILNADVQLPDGARILEFRGSGHDESISEDISFRLIRRDLFGFTGYQIAEATTTGSSGDQIATDTTMLGGVDVVDNANGFYSVNVSGATGGDRYIYGAQILVRLAAP